MALIEIDGLAFLNMEIFHGKLLNNQIVNHHLPMVFLLKLPFSMANCECHNQMVSPIEFSNENLSIHGEVFLHEIRPIRWIPTRQVAGASDHEIHRKKQDSHLGKPP
jgi:hypothetical protein